MVSIPATCSVAVPTLNSPYFAWYEPLADREGDGGRAGDSRGSGSGSGRGGGGRRCRRRVPARGVAADRVRLGAERRGEHEQRRDRAGGADDRAGAPRREQLAPRLHAG